MVSCSLCTNSILVSQKRIKCTSCNHQYHKECVNFTGDRSAFICGTCKKETTETSRTAIPPSDSRENNDFQNLVNSNNESINLRQFQQMLNNTLDIKIREMEQRLQEIMRNEIRTEIEKLKSEFTIATDWLQEEQVDLKASLADSNKTIAKLETDISAMQTEINSLKNRLYDTEKLSRSLNIEIQAVPEKKNENLMYIFQKLCQTVSCEISNSEIISCRRVAKMDNKSPRPRNILVTLVTPRHRDNLISAVKRYNNSHPQDILRSSHLDIPGESSTIYVNEHLSPELKMLYAAARKFKKTHSYKYVWVKFSKIYLRKDDNSGIIYVKNHKFLDNLSK